MMNILINLLMYEQVQYRNAGLRESVSIFQESHQVNDFVNHRVRKYRWKEKQSCLQLCLLTSLVRFTAHTHILYKNICV